MFSICCWPPKRGTIFKIYTNRLSLSELYALLYDQIHSKNHVLCAGMSSLILAKLHELFMVHEKLNSHIFLLRLRSGSGLCCWKNPLLLTANFP